ncbi:MAG: polyketide cyclase [Oceanicoccus sp.]|uniref:SRPBCC family protein n=1 Tax=Oceanicoccus sp. TaxID=2691044 RepID=UPI002610C1ED|nr:SRPBCC family protein [Oceanicoccus sp.]MCP3907242.1 polyketide cyclase [Oceanicoccus sp.]MDG1772635.1 SRPBCC family protein [Oceanicoccus sp.]
MSLETPPLARATMLIRRPIEEVFRAFVDPDITTRFWFSRSTGQLSVGNTVTWFWDHYGVSAEVFVKAIEECQRIEIEWPTPVEWVFTSRGDTTFVEIIASGFTGSDDEQVAQALDSTEGFNLVISACKAFLEHGIELKLVTDKNPYAGDNNGD